MKLNELAVGKTYFGATIDYKRGHGTHRTVIGIDTDLVSFRNEVGTNPPACYVMLATMGTEEFAAWAEKEVPTPPRAANFDAAA